MMSARDLVLVSLLAVVPGLGHGGQDEAAKYYEDGLTRFEQNDVDGAIIQLKNALQQDKNMLPVHVLLGKALLAAGDAAAALPHAERGVALYRAVHVAASPWRAEAEATRAIALLRTGRPAEADAALAVARTALAQHRELSPQFRAPLLQADALAREAGGSRRIASRR